MSLPILANYTLDTYLHICFLFLSFQLLTKSCLLLGRVSQCLSWRKLPFVLISDAQLHQHGEEPDGGVPPPHRPGGRVARHQQEGGRRGGRGYGRGVASSSIHQKYWSQTVRNTLVDRAGTNTVDRPYLRSAEHTGRTEAVDVYKLSVTENIFYSCYISDTQVGNCELPGWNELAQSWNGNWQVVAWSKFQCLNVRARWDNT